MRKDTAYIWSLMGMATLIQRFLPRQVSKMIKSYLNKAWKILSGAESYCSFHFQETASRRSNHLYRVVERHLQAKSLFRDADELCLSREENEDRIHYKLAGNKTVTETYEGVTVWWNYSAGTDPSRNGGGEKEVNQFILKMHRKDKGFVMSTYMAYVTSSAHEYKSQMKELYLYSCSNTHWNPHYFKHPSTFDTLAMDPPQKERLLDDLKAFVDGQSFFKKVGRPWKRGYLLYGPPGTGKSSMIAAMANYLKYNVYDLELTQVYDNSQLKQLLTHTTSKSIIVIEDIDCSLDLVGTRTPTRSKEPRGSKKNASSAASSKVTLAGLLNFTDGLWSCCGNERIIVFTTNHIEKLDPGLLRPGRMDMHIHMSYCNFQIFKVLAMNYMSVSSHPLFDTVEQLLGDGVCITPAQVTEFLFMYKADVDLALKCLIEDLERRKMAADVVLIGESDTKEDSELAEDSELDVSADDATSCTELHCNIKSHQEAFDWRLRRSILERRFRGEKRLPVPKGRVSGQSRWLS